jgi:hypothetical protein
MPVAAAAIDAGLLVRYAGDIGHWSHVENARIKPSEVARRSMYFCMIEEPVGMTSRAGTAETTGSIAGQRWPEMSPTAKTYSEGAIVRGCGRGICSG